VPTAADSFDRSAPGRRRHMLVWLAAVVTLGSGVLNLLSVIGPSLIERRLLLREIFPLEFLAVSRFLTLLTGFALVICSLNIARRKRRAYQLTLLLASASVFFHMAKGLDYEEAAFSLGLVALLAMARSTFTVESREFDVRGVVVRLATAGLIAAGYGIAGFWLLDPHQFGVNFHWHDAIQETWLFLSLQGDLHVMPHTRYAHWFLDSLYLVTITAIVYSIWAVFRPVIYAYAMHPHELARAREILAQFGRTAQDYFKTWPDKSLFFARHGGAFLAYSVGGNFAVVLGDPVGPEDGIEEAVREFVEFCRNNDWGLAFHQATPELLPLYLKCGFKKLKIGDEAIVDLTSFTTEGKKSREFKQIPKLEKQGVHTALYEPPVAEAVLGEIKVISDEWLEIPGRRERQFALGRFELNYLRATPVFAALDQDGRILAFVNLVRSYRKGEATADLMRRRGRAPNGIMDYLFIKAFLHAKESGFERFNLGLAPMAGFQEKEEATPEERAVHFFFQRLNFMFSYRGLRDYKAKFATAWEPRYEIYRNALDLPRLALAIGRVSEVKE
jgi:phosphatidylglycerol lysyltransferase